MAEGDAAVGTRVEDGIAIVTVDNPPVNALSQQVRAGLLEAIGPAAADPAVKAVILICAGRTFIAGADISEFDKPPLDPALSQVLDAIENAGKPVVAAIHGSALGGGFEVALAAHHRVALATARLGLPEIRLGLIPGAGGTQRLPRLVGVEAALRIILTGAPVEADAAAAMGAIDRVVEAGGDLLPAAIDHVRARLDGVAPVVRTRDRVAAAWLDTDRRILAAVRAEQAGRQDGQIAWRHAIDAIETGMEHGFDAGLAAERASFLELRGSPQARTLREAFFAARKAARSS